MKNEKYPKLIVTYLIVAVLAAGTSFADAQDVDLDFHFLKFGLPRKAVLSLLGTPDSVTEWQTFAIKHHRLIWVGPEGGKYIASFLNDRLFRWKKCSAGVADC